MTILDTRYPTVLGAKDPSDGYIVSWCLEGHEAEVEWRLEHFACDIVQLTVDEAVECLNAQTDRTYQ